MILRLAAAILLAVSLIGQTFDKLKAGETRQGFQAIAVYLNNSDQSMGARFVHARTGFTLDLLQIETAPQAQLWVPATRDEIPPRLKHCPWGPAPLTLRNLLRSISSIQLPDRSVLSRVRNHH